MTAPSEEELQVLFAGKMEAQYGANWLTNVNEHTYQVEIGKLHAQLCRELSASHAQSQDILEESYRQVRAHFARERNKTVAV